MKIQTIKLSILLLFIIVGFADAKGQDNTQLTSGYFVKVTSQDEIVDGGQYLIVKEDTKKSYAAGNIEGSNKYITAVEISTTGIYNGSVNSEGFPYVFTFLKRDKGGFHIKIDGQYLVNSEGATTLIKQSSSYYSAWEINRVSSGFTIIAMSDKERRIQYTTSNSGCFSNYKTTNGAVQLYKLSSTITINPACTDGKTCYSTYSNSSAFVVPYDLTVSTVGADTNGKLIVSNYNTGNIVAANTGVMVSGSAGEHIIVLTTAEGTEAPGPNNLHPSSETMSGNYLFYRLTMHNGTEIGYWWGAESGAAFNLSENKAYLAIPTGTEIKERGLWFDNSASVKYVINDDEKEDLIYDLSGRRVINPTTGIYIVNGKKQYIK